MKLSDIKGEKVFDVIADIIEPVATIAQDKEAMALFDASGKPEDMGGWDWFVERAKKSVPVLMRTYKHELCVILATINGVSVDEYVNGKPNPDYDPDDPESQERIGGLSVPKLFSNVIELVTDSEFISFFS